MKKTILVLTVFALTAALFFPAISATAAFSAVSGFSGVRSLNDHYSLGQSGDPEDIVIESGAEIRIPLTADMFTWSDGREPVNREAMMLAQLKSGSVRVRTKVRSGSEILDYVQFDIDTFDGASFISPNTTNRTNKTAYVSIKFAKNFFETEEVEFDYTVYITIGGHYYEELAIRLTGAMTYNLVELDANADYVNIDDGVVLEAQDNIPYIRSDFGSGVIIHSRMYKDERYTGYVEIVDGKSGLEGDLQELPVLYPDIVGVYRLHTIGYRASDKVTLDIRMNEYLGPDTDEPVSRISEYHVYGEDMSYLGTTSQELAFSPVYFLAESRIDSLEGMQGEVEYEVAPRGGIRSSQSAQAEEAEASTDEDAV